MHSKLIKFLVEFLVENNLAYGRIFLLTMPFINFIDIMSSHKPYPILQK